LAAKLLSPFKVVVGWEKMISDGDGSQDFKGNGRRSREITIETLDEFCINMVS